MNWWKLAAQKPLQLGTKMHTNDLNIDSEKDDKQNAKAFVSMVRSWGYPNPLNEREVVIGEGAVCVTYFDGAANLASIRAFNPKQGWGTEMMHRLTSLANQMGVKLTLVPEPFGSQKHEMPQRQLMKWYQRFGFTSDGDQMQRPPLPPTPEAPSDSPRSVRARPPRRSV